MVTHVQCQCVVASLGCRLTEFREVGAIESAAVAMDQQQGARTRLRGVKDDAVQAHTIGGAQGYQFGRGTRPTRREVRRWRLSLCPCDSPCDTQRKQGVRQQCAKCRHLATPTMASSLWCPRPAPKGALMTRHLWYA